MASRVRLSVNGVARQLDVAPERRLLGVLRGELGLTGAKPGCGEGACGACTVLVDGVPVHACQTSAGEAAGHEVVTIEGLARGGRLHAAQQAFAEIAAMQCGYCTPGFVLATAALLAEHPHPDAAQVREALDGNICRCGTYPRILRAVDRAAELLAAGGPAPAAEATGGDDLAPGPETPWDLLPPDERRYFDVLGDGLVAVLRADPGRYRGHHGGAWLHVGPGGTVTAFSGKADVGQQTRTALTLLVAEELGVPAAAVRVVMGDTDLCPYDFGTFGSRSMPDAGPALRAAAAAARQALDALAAEHPDAAGWAGLLGGLRRLVEAEADLPLTPAARWRTAGHPARSPLNADAVTGAKRFPSDVSPPGMLHGRILRPPVRGAELESADVTGARALPGVTVVQEGAFVAVAAPSFAGAQRALGAIAARWRPPAEPEPDEAGLAAHLRSHPVETRGWQGRFRQEQGDIAALDGAAVRLRATYTTAYIAHVPLETRAATAQWQDDGRLTVWTGTQRPFGVRAELAEALGIPEAGVRVIVPPTGSGFGGRHTGQAAIEAARLARAAGRPVQVRWNREEEFTCGYFRPASVIDVESGADGDGRLLAWRLHNINSGAAGIGCPYDVPNQLITHQPAASPLPQGSYRALAATANAFARETHLDELAGRLGVDPLEFRLRHLGGDERLAAVLRAAAERAGWAGRVREPGRGMGIACGAEKGGRIATCAEVQVDGGGRLRVLRLVSAFECGAIVHPDGLANQVEGATVMGLGGALFEAIHFEGGRILNASLLRYRVPRLGDVPPVEVVLLDRPDLPPAGGGETPIIAVAPALGNAIFAATGVRLRDLPLAPDGVVG